jgi:hypothetical protein
MHPESVQYMYQEACEKRDSQSGRYQDRVFRDVTPCRLPTRISY